MCSSDLLNLNVQDKMELEVEAYLRRRYEGEIADIEIIEKEDLDLVCALMCMFNSLYQIACIRKCYHCDEFDFMFIRFFLRGILISLQLICIGSLTYLGSLLY